MDRDGIDAVALLTELVRIPSLSGHEEDAAAYLVAQMHAHGLHAFVDAAGNAVGQAGSAGPLVALLGHIDTVSGAPPVHIADGVLYGRGSVDAKGALAAFVCATARALQAGTLGCRVVVIGATEEEAATSKGAHYAVTQYQPDYCIIGEPSGWQRITLGYKGRLLVRYRHEQPAAHSAGEMPAAPEHMVEFWQAVQAYASAFNSDHPRLFDQVMPSLREVASGSDGIGEWAEALIGLRLPPNLGPEMLQATLSGMLETLADIDKGEAQGTTTLDFAGACPAFRGPRTTPLVGALGRAIRAAGGVPGYLHKTGTSDMNVAGPAWQCPIVAYGPGDARLDHTPNEHLPLADYQRAIGVLEHVLTNLP